MSTLEPGQSAPEFSVQNHRGETVALRSLREGGVVVVYFYPKDESPGCTAQACSFRDAYGDLVDAGAAVVGVSGDSVESHQAFAERHGLPFHLVSDTDGALRRAYGVKKTLGLLPGRETFVIDRQGMIRHVFRSQLMANKHVEEAVQAVRELL
ncbi:MAG: peroxiredoxin [Myxococcales bacterium]|nr:peroxiredoxin [Myxococcales bacterium]